jgi:tRNA A-37 threonylcarbamoyl transferase component Bud32
VSVMLDSCPRCGEKPPANAVVCPNDSEVLVPPDSDPLVGQIVGSYRVIKRLGIGGMGSVYEGLETNINKRAALKIVHPHLSADPRLPSLMAEAKAVNAIGDEGIVDIYGFGTLPDGRSYLVMELLEGELLETRLARQLRFGVTEAIDLLAPLLQALEAAHAAGFVHRDIKTANIFIVRRAHRAPFPKLLDFGIAQRIKSVSSCAVGTADYIAPEQAANVGVGAKADLYALGCVMFEMFSGQLPFNDAEPLEVVRQHQESVRPSLKELAEVPDSIDALVRSMMSIDPEHRPASSAAVRTALLEIRAQVQPRPRRKWPWAVAAVSVAALGLIAFFARGSPAVEAVVPAGPPIEDPVANAATRAAAEIERKLAADPASAVQDLLASQSSFSGRPEWPALRSRLEAALRVDAAAALEKNDAETATRLLAEVARLGPIVKDDPLDREAKRVAFAVRNGMARVGDVFIDRYEYPNRAGAIPATKVDWAEAMKLCENAGKHLCSEAEWESACQGTAGRAYPYGAKLEKGRCVSKSKKVKRAAVAGSRPRCVSPAGVFDLSGNVAEWTASPLREGAPQRVTRGGSFGQSDARLACGARDYSLPGLGGATHLGLRCCL